MRLPEAMEYTLEELASMYPSDTLLIDILELPNNGRFWTKSEEDLVSLYRHDESVLADISLRSGRKLSAIKNRIKQLFPTEYVKKKYPKKEPVKPQLYQDKEGNIYDD